MVVDAKTIEKKGNTIKVLVKGTDTEMMNSLRRAITTNVPTIAIEDITVYENDSVVFDEFLAHRMGLIPIKTDTKTYRKGEEVTLTLEKEGPCTVYGKDMKFSDPKIEAAGKKIPITKLRKNQKIKLEAKAVLGTAKDHSKFSPAIAGYREVSRIEISQDCDLCEECVKACPKNILEVKAKKIVMTNALECNECMACADYCPKNAVRITPNPGEFILTVESIGQLENSEIIELGIKELEEKVQEFRKSLAALKE